MRLRKRGFTCTSTSVVLSDAYGRTSGGACFIDIIFMSTGNSYISTLRGNAQKPGISSQQTIKHHPDHIREQNVWWAKRYMLWIFWFTKTNIFPEALIKLSFEFLIFFLQLFNQLGSMQCCFVQRDVIVSLYIKLV